MQELRLVAVSEDGSYLVLATAGRGTRFTLPVDDRLRAAVRGHFSRLGQFEIEVESPLRPKEIQARIRAGETAEEIAESAGIPVERVRWFEGPVLQEREYMAQQAQRVTVRRQGETSTGPPLGEMVEERLGRRSVDLEDVEWDSWKCEDSTWRVRLSFYDQGRPQAAEWVFDPRRRQVSPLDEEAARLSSLELDASLAPAVTPLMPRRPAMKIVSDTEPRREYGRGPETLRRPVMPPRREPLAPPEPRTYEPVAVYAPDPYEAAPEENAEAIAGIYVGEPAESFQITPTPVADTRWERPPVPAAPRNTDPVRPVPGVGPFEAVPEREPAEVTPFDVGTPVPDPADFAPPAPEAIPEPAEEFVPGPMQEPAAVAEPVEVPAVEPVVAPVAEPVATAKPVPAREPVAARAPEPAAVQVAEPVPVPEPTPVQVAEPVPEPVPVPEPTPVQVAEPVPEPASAPRPAAAEVPAAAAEAPQTVPEPIVVPEPQEVLEPVAAVAAAPAPPADPPARGARRKNSARGKRASVPSWDEIMFGARRPE